MPLSRKKSCAPCRESKARCDRTIPECSRCTMRHLTCVYDGKEAYRPVASPHLGRPQVTKLVPSATEQDTLFDQEVVTTGSWEALMEGAGPVSSEDFDLARPGATSGVQLRLWPEKDDMHSLPETGGFTTINDPWALLQEPEDTSSTTVMQRNLPPVPGDDGDGLPHQALLRRNMFRACTMCTIILGQLTSFPKLLIEGDRLPPFIHAPCHIEDGLAVECGERGSHQCLPRELAICAGLVEMFYARTRANTDFVWTAIYDERARLQRAYPMLAPTEQLAALQSVTVLLLLQASDPTTVETNDSGLLLNTVLVCMFPLDHCCYRSTDTGSTAVRASLPASHGHMSGYQKCEMPPRTAVTGCL